MIKPADLPQTVAVFPLPGALLLPRSRLPLHIFEPRYLQMLEDALKTPERLIGMIQPNPRPGADEALHRCVRKGPFSPIAGAEAPAGVAAKPRRALLGT